MTELNAALLISAGLWFCALNCHARLQAAWQRRHGWSPSPVARRLIGMGRILCPFAGLVCAVLLSGTEGAIGWIGVSGVAGVCVALLDAYATR